jgi:hypothetical protein
MRTVDSERADSRIVASVIECQPGRDRTDEDLVHGAVNADESSVDTELRVTLPGLSATPRPALHIVARPVDPFGQTDDQRVRLSRMRMMSEVRSEEIDEIEHLRALRSVTFLSLQDVNDRRLRHTRRLTHHSLNHRRIERPAVLKHRQPLRI